MKEYLTVCPRNCYSTCSCRVFTDENRVVRILPDKTNRVTPEGPCLKGLSYIERSASSQRLTEPLLRDGNGNFNPVSYPEALAIIISKLRPIIESNSQKSVLYYTGSGMSGLTNQIGYNFFRLFGGATTTYGNFCWPAGLEAVRLAFGEIKQSAPWDLENAGLIIIWGKNPAETNIQESIFIEKASARGSKIVVIDPRRTPTAEKADILITPRPGTDGALALAISEYLVSRKMVDKEFISKYVMGYEQFSQSLSITPGDAEKITGIPSGEIIKLAELIAGCSSVTIIAGFGLQRYTNGGQTIRAILSICAITGNIGRSGAGFNYANLHGYIFDSIKEPLSYYPEVDATPGFRREVSMARLGKDLLSLTDPEITFAWIERGNPMTQAPDSSTVSDAFSKIGFKVVVDQFMTDTARIADLILPAKNMFEQQDIISSYWSPYIIYRPRVIDPPGSVKPETEIYYDLARLLNLKFTNTDIPHPGEESLDEWLAGRISGYSELTLADIKRGKIVSPGYQEVAYSDLMFDTPSGRIELISTFVKERWGSDEIPTYNRPFTGEDHTRHKFIFLTPNTKNRIHSQFGNLESIKLNDPFPTVQINPADAQKYGLVRGDMVRIYNDRGAITVRADVTAAILTGVLSTPNGWWISEGAGGNFLSAGRETDLGHGTAFHDNLVSIERVEDE